MPVIRQLPDSKRRSRTGCLPCRNRRRKCDETKPACRNCTSRDVACEYADWAFVPEAPYGAFTATSRASPLATERNVSQSNTVPSPSISILSQQLSQQAAATTASAYQSQVGEALPSHRPSAPRSSTAGSTADVLSLAAGESGNGSVRVGSWTSTLTTSTHTHDDLAYEIATPSRWINANYAPHGPTDASSALLRFRYRVVPRIDSNNGRSVFGPAMMTLARSSKAVSDCIFHFMRSRDENMGVPGAAMSGDSDDARQRLLDRLSREAPLEADVGHALLAMSDIFCTPPSEWAARLAPSVRHCAEGISKSRVAGFVTEPLKTLLRLHLKIDLAASILANSPPSTSIFLPSQDAMMNDASLTMQTYDECLGCLANSLRLVHHELIPQLSQFHEPQPQQPTGSRSSPYHQWSDLWATCTLWFQARPRVMEPVLEAPDVTADHQAQGDPFPPDVFTSTTALQANLVMHMSAIILLAHRPRLGDVAGLSPRLKSRSWHVHKIARMLVGNHFREQWDPIVIAALLFVAKEMSHVSQQNAILTCFQTIARTTHIPMEKDVAGLREGWRLIYDK